MNCTFSPSLINITTPSTRAEFNVTCWRSGVVTVIFTLDGASASMHVLPPPTILFVSPDPITRPNVEIDIFERLGIAEDTLPPATDPITGEATNVVTISLASYSGDLVYVSFSSTMGWCRNEDNTVATGGVAYVDSAGLTIPIALQGIVISTDTLKVQYKNPTTLNESCSNSTNIFSAIDIQELISQNTLANHYFSSVSTIFPSWLNFYALPQVNVSSVNNADFIVSIEPGIEVVERSPCRSLPVETENHCITLTYTGDLQVTVGGFNTTFESQHGICFVNILTAGTSSPLFIGRLDINALHMLGFVQDLANNGWHISSLNGVSLGINQPVAANITFEPFKTPFGLTTGSLASPNMWMNGYIQKSFFDYYYFEGFHISISGDSYWNVPDIDNVRVHWLTTFYFFV